MEFISCESVCRCCLTNAGTFSSIFKICNDYYLPKVINACTGITVQQSDGLTEVVCENCLLKLITAYETRRLFIRSNGQLREQLSRLKQSEQEILSELKSSTAAEYVAQGASSDLGGDLMASVENILEEQGPITTWDNEINMHIEQLQDSGGDLVGDIEACLDELVIEKCQNLEKGGYSFPVSEPIGQVDSEFPANEENGVTEEDDPQDEIDFPDFSDLNESSSSEESDSEGNEVSEAKQEEPQDCPICGKRYWNSRLLQRHVQYHNASKIECPICQKSFTHGSNLKRHLNSHVAPPEGFACSSCSKKFDLGSQLYDHLKLHKNSPGDRRADSYTLRCDLCEVETISLAGFVSHMALEHNVPKNLVKAFRCHLCSIRFVSKQGMFRHIQSVHENQKPIEDKTKKFQCTECGKCFQRMRHLREHANSHTGIRPYLCECGASFSQQSGLNLHIRAKHENRKSHICRICRKSFAQSTHLKHHELIHSNRKEHECAVCKHRFRVKSNLVAHMRTHRRNPYCCTECAKEYSLKEQLEQHLLEDHGGAVKGK